MTLGSEESWFDSKAVVEKGVSGKEAGIDWVRHRCYPMEIQRDPQGLKHSLEAVQLGLTEHLARSTVSRRECTHLYTTFLSVQTAQGHTHPGADSAPILLLSSQLCACYIF